MGKSDLPLNGQTALVTGASSGIGRRFAAILAAVGAKVVVAARRTDRLAALVAEIEGEGGMAAAVELDVADPDSIAAAIDAAERAFGRITILINNAGVADVADATDIGLAAIDHMTTVNLRGPFLLAREVARRLIADGAPGRIVNVSSIVAYTYDGHVPVAYYAMTKAAIVRMTEVLAVEWAKYFINVNAIAPGFVVTEMNQEVVEEKGVALASRRARGRLTQPANLDSTLLYLVSPDSGYVTGSCIRLDDGQMPR
ncbi:SDR family NAD(P)-dependent oxidoreductase [Sphingomonas sp. 67-36]|nr:SDR family NAD(P)-dependent oxidoreductase [Sphingomonas sp. 67-36]MBN8848641.1 SDR family oxidoreductase [Sphingomonas sp.]OJV34771.1 MAG: short-chain dehydrogenase [Sphingomonas sp. 67-36]